MTKAVYRFNGQIGEDENQGDVLRQVVFWVFVILPVYGIAMIGDALIFNLIEFWSGEPLEVTKQTDENGTAYTLVPSADGKELVLSMAPKNQPERALRFVRVSDTVCHALDSSGQVAGMVIRTPDGSLNLTDADGHVIHTLAASELARAGRL